MYEEMGKRMRGRLDKHELKEDFLLDAEKEKERKTGLPQGAAPDFGKAIKKLLEKNKMDEKTLAKLSGINERSIRSIENRSTINPSFDCLERIAAAFGMPVQEFITFAWANYKGNRYKTLPSERWSISYELDKGFSIHVFSPPSMSRRDFFVGVVTILPKMKPNYWQFPGAAAKACFQPWDGKIIFTYHGLNWKEEEEVLANQTLYYDPSIPHSFENPSQKSSVRMLLLTYPSLF